MSFWGGLFGWLGSSDSATGSDDTDCSINPANGLPMVGGCGGMDIEGNPYGCDTSSSISEDTSGLDSLSILGSDDTFSSFDDSSFSSSDD